METATKRNELDSYIASLPIAYSAVFVPQSQSRKAGEKNLSINWKITITGKNNNLTTDYMQGIGHIPNYPKIVPFNSRRTIAVEAFEKLASEKGIAAPNLSSRYGDKLNPPTLKGVLYSLISDSDVLNYDSFESWAGDLGYDTDSRKAEKIYRDCIAIALKLKGIIGNEAMEKLRELFQDY